MKHFDFVMTNLGFVKENDYWHGLSMGTDRGSTSISIGRKDGYWMVHARGKTWAFPSFATMSEKWLDHVWILGNSSRVYGIELYENDVVYFDVDYREGLGNVVSYDEDGAALVLETLRNPNLRGIVRDWLADREDSRIPI